MEMMCLCVADALSSVRAVYDVLHTRQTKHTNREKKCAREKREANRLMKLVCGFMNACVSTIIHICVCACKVYYIVYIVEHNSTDSDSAPANTI